MTFNDRLTALGYATYEEYLRSAHWTDFKVRYRRSALTQFCAVCNRKQVELHHHTYLRLGAELLTDVTPLCRKHHAAVHEWLTANHRGVGSTPVAVRHFKIVSRSRVTKPVVPRKPTAPTPAVKSSAPVTSEPKIPRVSYDGVKLVFLGKGTPSRKFVNKQRRKGKR